MFIRRAFTVFLAVQSEAGLAAGVPQVPRDCVVDWRWFEEEAAVMPAAAIAPPTTWLDTRQAVIRQR